MVRRPLPDKLVGLQRVRQGRLSKDAGVCCLRIKQGRDLAAQTQGLRDPLRTRVWLAVPSSTVGCRLWESGHRRTQAGL